MKRGTPLDFHPAVGSGKARILCRTESERRRSRLARAELKGVTFGTNQARVRRETGAKSAVALLSRQNSSHCAQYSRARPNHCLCHQSIRLGQGGLLCH